MTEQDQTRARACYVMLNSASRRSVEQVVNMTFTRDEWREMEFELKIQEKQENIERWTR